MAEPTHTPAGRYPRPAKIHHIDLEAAADRLIGELAGHGRRSENVAREGNVSVIIMAMASGDTVREHSADGVVTVQALRGRVTLTSDGEAAELRPGQVIVFQPGVRHDVHAEEQSALLLTVTGNHG